MKRALITTLLLFVLSSFSFGQDLGLKSITGQAGIVSPSTPWDLGFTIGAEADFGEIAEGFTLHPSISYWSSSYSYTGLSSNLEPSLSNFQLAGNVHYQIENIKGLYVGGGLGLNFFTYESPVFGGLGNFSSTDFGVSILSGYQLALGNMTGVIQGRYNLTNWNAFELTFGLLFDMSK
jgi:hypothetical protein